MTPPHAIDLFAFAVISADLAEGDRPAREVLEEKQLTDAQWAEVTVFWSARMGDNAREAALAGEEPRTALLFSEAFARAQDAKRPLVQLEVADWAALLRAVDEVGLPKALAARGLRLSDYSRLVRHWARRIATDRAVARELADL